VYEFVNEQHKTPSNKVLKSMPIYQIAFITNGTEEDNEPLKVVFNDAGVCYCKIFGVGLCANESPIKEILTDGGG
ncbi:hypothetical protein, partial [Bacillus mycoides]|uniref:hypothetical protein n=1 Tax=Bacillus mycoides TaxID=1405 RepID=UPI0021124ED3